ncbi:SUKH-4 family immunity protein [Streptomyces flavidovirens]|uniref:SUKH-4 family immunity protein n=1 Tax=Streptomyces flavidovirens TaxID=67298 RepID=A0ABW6RQY8_9ACTN
MNLAATADSFDSGVVSLEVPTDLIGYSYRAADSLEAFVISGVLFARFGHTEMFGSVLLNIATGEVVESGRDLREVSLVSTSMEHFSRCVQAVIGRFPFYSSDASDDEWELAAADVAQIVRSIDPKAYIEGGYWHEMASDIGMGDYATEDVVNR